MARGSDTAQQAATTGLGSAKSLQGQSGSIYGSLEPELASQVTNPTGMTPTEKANANTAAQQSAGGSESAAVGQGALHQARTRNAGGVGAGIAAGVRNAGKNLSEASLGTELEDARMREQNRRSAQAELGGLYGTATQGGNQALGETAANTNANSEAQNASWDWARFLADPLLNASSSAYSASQRGGS